MPEGLIVDYGNYDYIILQSFVCVVYENHVSSCCFCSDEELPSEKTTQSATNGSCSCIGFAAYNGLRWLSLHGNGQSGAGQRRQIAQMATLVRQLHILQRPAVACSARQLLARYGTSYLLAAQAVTTVHRLGGLLTVCGVGIAEWQCFYSQVPSFAKGVVVWPYCSAHVDVSIQPASVVDVVAFSCQLSFSFFFFVVLVVVVARPFKVLSICCFFCCFFLKV